MRHGLTGRQLSRNSPHRRAMLRNMAASLLKHETIRTTIPKAKELRRVVEPLITLGKQDSEARRRIAMSRLRDPGVVVKLFDDLGPRFKARPGGYMRILRMMPRPGDNAPMALVQLVDSAAAVEAAGDAGGRKKAKGKGKQAGAKKKSAAKGAAAEGADAGETKAPARKRKAAAG